MASRGGGATGFSAGMLFGLAGLVVTLGIVGMLWKEQFDSLSSRAKEGGAASPLAVIDSTKLTGTMLKLKELAGAIENWRVEHGGYPPDLSTARERSGSPSDSWGGEIVYAPKRPMGNDNDGMKMFGTYTLTSRGMDGLLDTDDDLVFENGFIRGGVPDMLGHPGGQVAHSDPVGEEARTVTDGMVDPGPSSEALPAARRALEQARGIAASPRGDGGGGGE
ncbi:MAG: hypothetical protein U0166_14940 [Acidobacteriota bacterium]